jgi:Phage tail lysozyme
LLAGLAALGIIGAGAYGAYGAWEAGRRWFGADEGTEAAGHGGARRGRFGHGGAGGQGGGGSADSGRAAHPRGSALANIPAAMAAMEDQLRKEGVPEANVHAAAALMIGQALSESPLNPDEIHDHGTGYGIYGARLDRRTRMLAWLAQHGYAKNSLEGQAREMGHSAMTDPRFAATRHALMNATETGFVAATHVITPNFESPLNDNSAARVRNVRAAFENARKKLSTPLTPSVDFRKRLDEIRSAKPLVPWQQSMNEIHDHRSVINDVNINVAGSSPINRTERALSRPRNADLIRNTACYAA